VAKQTTVTIIDDIDGSSGAEQVEFAFEGRSYEIDLSPGNADRLREALAPYLSAARRTGTARRPAAPAAPAPRNGTPRNGTDRERNQAIREWAGQNGFKIAERGRIPANVIEAFDQAH
jgi:hypothetical protein